MDLWRIHDSWLAGMNECLRAYDADPYRSKPPLHRQRALLDKVPAGGSQALRMQMAGPFQIDLPLSGPPPTPSRFF